MVRPDDLLARADAVATGWEALGLVGGAQVEGGALGMWWALVEGCHQPVPERRAACVEAADTVIAKFGVEPPDPRTWDVVDTEARDAGYRLVRTLLTPGEMVVPLQLPSWAADLREG